MIIGEHHVGIAVSNIEAALKLYTDVLGIELDHIEELPDRHLRVAMLRVGDNTIELLEPTDESSTVAGFIAKRGEGIHHLALEVSDIDAMLAQLKAAGIRLVDEEARPGAGACRVAFLHPKSTGGVLLELVEEL